MTEMIITSSVLILVITIVRYLLKGELSVRVQYALWLPVAVRLLVPGTFLASTFSVLNAAPAVELPDRGNIYLSSQGITAQQPPPQIGRSLDGSTEYGIYYAPQENEYSFFPTDEPLPDWAANYTTVPASHILPTPKAALTAIWYIGMAAMGGWFLWVNLSFRKKLRAERRRVEVPDCPLPVFAAEGIPSPCLAGLFRPAIYVTPACLEDGDRLRHVLAHELAHRRHRDPLWSLVRCVCLTVYWFHPLVWLAASLSRRDCELACDESALRELGEEERTAYGRTLIGLIEVSASPVRLLQTATTMVDRKGGVKERLLFIAKKPRVVALTGVVAVLIAAIAAACTFTGAAEPSADYATVEEALADLPEEFRPTDSIVDGISIFTPEKRPGENLEGLVEATLEEGELFRAYSKFHIAISSNLSDPLGWMGSVYRMDQAAYDGLAAAQGLIGRKLNSYWECFAKDSEFYYLIYAPLTAPEMKTGLTEGAELQEKLIAWMKEAVLSAEGVEAFEGARFDYTYSAAGLTPDEMASFNTEFFDSLALFDNGADGTPVTAVGGYHGSDGLLHLSYRRGDAMGVVILRPDGDGYALVSNLYPAFKTSVNGGDEPSGGLAGAADAGRTVTFEHGRLKLEVSNVYETRRGSYSDGVEEPFAYDVYVVYPGATVTVLDADTWQSDDGQQHSNWKFHTAENELIRLEDVTGPVAITAGGTRAVRGVYSESAYILIFELYGGQELSAQDAFRRVLSGDNSILAEGDMENYWAGNFSREDLVYILMDVDEDGEVELLLQHESGPAASNAVLDCRYGWVYVWQADYAGGSSFDYPLRDGRMVSESHSGYSYGYTIYRYNPMGERENLESFYHASAGGWSGETGEPEIWRHNGEDVTQAEFERLVEEKITSQMLDPSMWQEVNA